MRLLAPVRLNHRRCARAGVLTKLSLGLLSCSLLVATRAEDFQCATYKLEYERAPLQYDEQTPTDAVARLQHRLATGETKLPFDEKFGYLPALLDALKVPPASQILVFS